MTVINNQHGFIFIHIPKNAGTSVTQVLSQLTTWMDVEIGGSTYGEELAKIYQKRFFIGKHSPAVSVKKVVGDHVWDKYCKFAFVRNPYTRTVSTYYFLRRWRNWTDSEVMNGMPSFESFIFSRFFLEGVGPDRIFNPQFKWIFANEECIVDYVGSTECLENDLSLALSKTGIDTGNIVVPSANKGDDSSSLCLEYSEDIINVINEKYSKDFELFGYSKVSKPEDFATASLSRQRQLLSVPQTR